MVRHRVNWWRSWHKVGQREKLTTAAVYADHFGASSFLVFFMHKLLNAKPFLKCY